MPEKANIQAYFSNHSVAKMRKRFTRWNFLCYTIPEGTQSILELDLRILVIDRGATTNGVGRSAYKVDMSCHTLTLEFIELYSLFLNL